MVPSMTCGDCPAVAACHQGSAHKSKGTTATPDTCVQIRWIPKPLGAPLPKSRTLGDRLRDGK